MKISFDCECILLQESLKIFLKDFISSRKDCDFIISDRTIVSQKPIFLITKNSGHLQIPFTRETLLSTLEEFYSAMQISLSNRENTSNSSFERDLDALLKNFKNDLIVLFRTYQ
jgi:hypothetical protein